MKNKFRRWAFFLVIMISFSIILPSCAELLKALEATETTTDKDNKNNDTNNETNTNNTSKGKK